MGMTAFSGSPGVVFPDHSGIQFLRHLDQALKHLTGATLPSPSRSPCGTSLGTTDTLSYLQ